MDDPDPPVGEEELRAVLTSFPTPALTKTLAALLRSPDPLLSYRAATFLVEGAKNPTDFPLGAWYLGLPFQSLLNFDEHAGLFLPARGVANLVEACRRLVGTEADDGAEEEEGAREAGEGARARDERWNALTLIGFRFSALHRMAIRFVEASSASAAEPFEEAQLPLIGVLKLLREMLPWRSRLNPELSGLLPMEVTGLCHAAWEAVGKRAVKEGLPSPFSGFVVVRQLVLELAMDYVGEFCLSRGLRREMGLLDLEGIWRDVPAAIPEAEEPEPAAGDGAGACSLVRTPRSSDLLPYRLALLAKLLRRAAEAASQEKPAGFRYWPSDGSWMDLFELLHCPLRQRFVVAERAHQEEEAASEGGVSSPLISALLDHDDLLFAALTDLQCACVTLLTQPPALHARMFPPETDVAEAEAVLRGFQRAAFPPRLFAALLEAVDEELFLDYLISNETAALEYVTRTAKFLVWYLKGRGDEREGESEEEKKAVAEAGPFVVALGARLKGQVDRGLFPYDISPLLERVRKLREALGG